MKFESRKDIEAPQAFVFQAASDFSAFERRALRRNIEITRTDAGGPDGVGMAWALRFALRGRPRRMQAGLRAFDLPSGYVLSGTTEGLDVEAVVDLMALSPSTTRIFITLDLVPRTLTARLLVQSLKLVRRSVAAKLDARAAGFARDIEESWREGPGRAR